MLTSCFFKIWRNQHLLRQPICYMRPSSNSVTVANWITSRRWAESRVTLIRRRYQISIFVIPTKTACKLTRYTIKSIRLNHHVELVYVFLFRETNQEGLSSTNAANDFRYHRAHETNMMSIKEMTSLPPLCKSSWQHCNTYVVTHINLLDESQIIVPTIFMHHESLTTTSWLVTI